MKEKIVLAYRVDFQQMYFSKDNFLIPYYIAKEKGLQLHYYYSFNMGNSNIPNEHRGVFMHGDSNKHSVSAKDEIMDMFKCILRNAQTIDTLFLNGSSAKHLLAIRIYKLLNPKGNVIVFGDMERPQAEELNRNGFQYSKGLMGKMKSYLVDYMFNHSVYTIGNTEAYNIMKELCGRKGWKGLLHFYPCLDDELFYQYGMVRRSWEEKENIMICVGRIGNYQKNTEMLLDALAKTDIGDWKIYMIGPITSSFDLKEKGDFQHTIDNFFCEHPEYREKLIFTGMIYDQKVVFDFYNRAKIFLSTARHEGFANTFSQAAAFGCYIVSTDVGGADVASNNWQFGTRLDQEDSDGLAKVLNNLAGGNIIIDDKMSLSLKEMSYSSRVCDILIPKIQSM